MDNFIPPQQYLPDTFIHPGLSLTEILESRGISQAELARRLDKPAQAINEIIMGKKQIIPETAIALEHVLGIPASFWLNLESNYREALAREKENKELQHQVKLVRNFPYLEMAKFEWVKVTRNPIERVQELLKWLGISNLNLLETQYALAFRKSQRRLISKEKLAVWLRHGEIEMQGQSLGEFNKDSVEDLMISLRKSTLKNIEEGSKEAIELCSRCGIALVFTPEFKSFPVSGVTRWNENHPLVQVSLRFKTDDHFWYSIFHELGHVFLHKREMFIEMTNRTEDSLENEADRFAENYLIPQDCYEKFVLKGVFDSFSVARFAEQIGIAKGIVVGRLQHDKKIEMNKLYYLKNKLYWK